jgi:hypothetical protein
MILPLSMQIKQDVTFDSTTGDDEVTVNLTAHGLIVGDYFKFKSVILPGGGVTGYTTADFHNKCI